MDIGSLTGQVAIEDQVTDSLTKIIGNVRHFAEDFDGAFGAMAIGIGVLTGAVVGAVISIEHLGEKGSVVIGVEDNFNKLALAAGTTGDVLRGSLSEGVKGTVDEMTLMQSTSRLLTSGMTLTTDQMLLMGEASRAMGKATGTDAAGGLQTLSSALLTGRTRALAMAGIIVDTKTAEEEYAKSLGVTADQLSREGKLHADRIAILDATQKYVDRLGVSQLSFKERVQQAGVAVEEWVVKLEKSVASSPNVMKALDAIQGAIEKAFGGDSQKMLDTIVGWVNDFADAVAEYGPGIIQTVADIWHGIQDVWHTVKDAWDDVPDWFKNVARDAGLAGAAVYIAKGSFDAIGGSDVLGNLSNLAQIWGTWGKSVLGFPAVAANAVTALYAMATAETSLIGVTVAATAPFIALAVAIASVTAAIYAAKVGWDIWRTSAANAAQDTSNLAAEQKNLADINKKFGTSFTDYGEAIKYAQDRMKEHNAGLILFGPAENDVQTAINKARATLKDSTKDMIDSTAALKAHAAHVKELEVAYNELDDKAKEVFSGPLKEVEARFAAQLMYDINSLEAAFLRVKNLSNGMAYSMPTGVKSAAVENIKAATPGGIFSGISTSLPSAILSALEGGGNVFAAAAGSLGQTLGTNVVGKFGDSIKKSLGPALGGALNSVLPAIGALAGPLISAIAGVFDHSKKDFRHAGEAMGVSFSDGLIAQLKADKAKYGGEVQALAVDLVQVIKEAGGLTPSNFDMFVGKLRDTFVLIENHQLTIADGTKVLEQNFAAFAAAGTDSLGLLDKKLLDIIALNDRLGTQSKEIAAYQATQAMAAAGGITAALQTTTAAQAALADLQKQAATAEGAALDALNAKMREQQAIIDATAIHSQSAASAVAAALLGAVATSMQAGASFIDAVKSIGPGIEALQKQLEATGFTGGAAFDFINAELKLANDTIAGPALTAIHGYTQGLVGLSNAGLLDQDTFSGLTGQISATEAALLAQGYSGKQVMAAMGSDLQTIWELQQKYGYQVDDSTQALLDQAVAEGIVGEKHKSTTEQMLDASNRMVDVLEAMATFFGVTLPAAAESGAKGVQTALDSINVPDWNAESAMGGATGSKGGSSYAMGGVVYAAGGANILPFAPRGTDTVPAMLTPGERVLTRAQNAEFSQATNQDVVDAIMGLRTEMGSKFPRAVARAVDAGLVGLRTRAS